MATTIPTPQRSMLTSKPKTKPKKKHRILKQLHIYGRLTPQILASGILLALIIWHFIGIPSPELRVTSFAVDEYPDTNSTIITYTITLHNPDLYKRIHYDILIMRLTYQIMGYRYGARINYIELAENKMVHQRPLKTTVLNDHTINCTQQGIVWVNKTALTFDKTSIDMRFVMQFRVLFFGRVISTRQRMRRASVYFDDDGIAFIPHHSGLPFK